MRRPSLAFAALLIGTAIHAQDRKVLGRQVTVTVPPTACDNTGIKFWWRIESDPLTTGDFYNGGDGDPVLTTMTIDASAPVGFPLGTNVLRSNSNGVVAYAEFDVTGDDLIDDCTGRVKVRFYWDNAAGWPLPGARIWRHDAGADGRIDLRARTTAGYIDITYRGASSTTTWPNADNAGAFISANTPHEIEVYYDCSGVGATDTLAIRVDGGAAVETNTASLQNWGVVQPRKLWIGNDGTGTAAVWKGPVYYDQVIVAGTKTKNLYDCRSLTSYP